jgi:hypothetical protein
MVTAAPWSSAGREKETVAGASGPAWLCWAGRAEQAARERERSVGASGPRARVRLGRATGEKWEAARIDGFCFSFSKNVNSNKFCLFCYELFKLPKMVRIVV